MDSAGIAGVACVFAPDHYWDVSHGGAAIGCASRASIFGADALPSGARWGLDHACPVDRALDHAVCRRARVPAGIEPKTSGTRLAVERPRASVVGAGRRPCASDRGPEVYRRRSLPMGGVLGADRKSAVTTAARRPNEQLEHPQCHMDRLRPHAGLGLFVADRLRDPRIFRPRTARARAGALPARVCQGLVRKHCCSDLCRLCPRLARGSRAARSASRQFVGVASHRRVARTGKHG
mmetsp:Transcript_13910/g.37906  ORF Transcript_13910/g.37906 Transcript_13910/m.37906 type:complete len:236 (+) Transcript_13910:101-808(+)